MASNTRIHRDCFTSLNCNSVMYNIIFFQFMFGVPKPEEDSALQRMLGKR